ncbi:hypothetical protein Hanom_Chr14g01273291 [Helianthus anomalus]
MRLTNSSNERVLEGLSYFFYVVRFGLISQQRACVIQRFYVWFSLGVIFFSFFYFVFTSFSGVGGR